MSNQPKTIGEALEDLRELEGRTAVLETAVSYLKTRYVGRDSSMPIAQIKHPDGSPVGSAVVELVCQSLEDEIQEMKEAAAAWRGTVLDG